MSNLFCISDADFVRIYANSPACWIIICDNYDVMIKCLVNVVNFLYKYIYVFDNFLNNC